MKPVTSVTILATFIAVAGAQGRRQSTGRDVDTVTTTVTVTTADAMAGTIFSIATDSDSADRSRTDSDALETPTDSGIDAQATSTLGDKITNTWTDNRFTLIPSMIASQSLSIPPKLTPIAGPPTAYASTSMLPAATTPIANPSLAKFNSARSHVGMLSFQWLVLGLISAVAAILL